MSFCVSLSKDITASINMRGKRKDAQVLKAHWHPWGYGSQKNKSQALAHSWGHCSKQWENSVMVTIIKCMWMNCKSYSQLFLNNIHQYSRGGWIQKGHKISHYLGNVLIWTWRARKWDMMNLSRLEEVSLSLSLSLIRRVSRPHSNRCYSWNTLKGSKCSWNVNKSSSFSLKCPCVHNYNGYTGVTVT